MNDIKSVLHLYLGCDVIVKSFVENEYGRLVGVGENGYHYVTLSGHGTTIMVHHDQLKPILSRLSDMTEEELKQWVNQSSFTEHYCKKKLREINHSVYGLYNFISFYGDHTSIPKILNMGYWIFGDEAFDKGLIIDKKTLQP